MATLLFEDLMGDDIDPIIPFGMHKGNYASNIDVEYLDWLIGQEWFCEGFAELEKRIVAHLRTRPEWQNL